MVQAGASSFRPGVCDGRLRFIKGGGRCHPTRPRVRIFIDRHLTSYPLWPTGGILPGYGDFAGHPLGRKGMIFVRRISGRRRWMAAGGVLIAAVTIFGVTPAEATTSSSSLTFDRADAAAGWLARQMTEGERFEDNFGFIVPNQNLTVDAVLAFTAAKTAGDFGARAMAWLARPAILSGYIGDGVSQSNATGAAKLALLVQARGGDPTSFGGVDLISRLRALQQPSGRFVDQTPFGDFSGIGTQAFAMIALDRTKAGAPPAAASFLTAARCADGGYPLLFDRPTCESEVETTAMAVQALIAVGRHADADVSLRWLLSVQLADGGFPNRNGVGHASGTGVAAQALHAAGKHVAEFKARSFLIGLQAGCSADPALRGAVPNLADFFQPPFATMRGTALAILGMTGSDFAHLSARGSRPGAPRLICLKR
jgi:hypothetical protein